MSLKVEKDVKVRLKKSSVVSFLLGKELEYPFVKTVDDDDILFGTSGLFESCVNGISFGVSPPDEHDEGAGESILEIVF